MFLKTSFVFLFALCSSSSGIYLECDYKFRDVENLGNRYSCEAIVHPSPNDKIISNVSHYHLVGYGDLNVEALIFKYNIDFTPLNIHSFFPNLVALNLYDRKTSELTRESLKGLESLKLINFGLNNLQIIETDLFIENPNIEWLFFENNPIRHVAFNVFDNLHGLHTLNMNETDCIDESATNDLDEVDILKFRFLVKCPPTFEMLEAKIVNGSLLQSIVSALVDSEIDPIHKKLDDIEEQQRQIVERVEKLEQNIEP